MCSDVLGGEGSDGRFDSGFESWFILLYSIKIIYILTTSAVNCSVMDKSCHRVDDTGIFVEKKSGQKLQKKLKSQIMPFRGLLKLRFIYKAEGASVLSFKLADSSDLKTFNRPFHPPYNY